MRADSDLIDALTEILDCKPEEILYVGPAGDNEVIVVRWKSGLAMGLWLDEVGVDQDGEMERLDIQVLHIPDWNDRPVRGGRHWSVGPWLWENCGWARWSDVYKPRTWN